MDLRAIGRHSKEQAAKTVKDWSLANYLFNLAVAGIPPLVFGYALKMPWPLQLALGCLTLVVMVTGMILWQSQRQDRLARAARRIRALADDINVSGIDFKPSFRFGPPRDPIREAAFELRAIVTAEIATDYERCASEKEAAVASKRFLDALADTLSPSHLRLN